MPSALVVALERWLSPCCGFAPQWQPVLLPVPPGPRQTQAEGALPLRTMEFSASADESRGQIFHLGRWVAEAIAHAFGNPREEAMHQPPLVGVQPYRDRPRRRGAR